MMLEKQIRILIEQYEKEYIDFMQISNLPSYELELFELNLSEINTTGFGSFAHTMCLKGETLSQTPKTPSLESTRSFGNKTRSLKRVSKIAAAQNRMFFMTVRRLQTASRI